jgi:predicted metal-binding membrane protein
MVADSLALKRVLRHDRLIIVGGLAGVVVLSWVYIFAGAGMNMGSNAGSPAMVEMQTAWTPTYFAVMVFMWWVMMVAMMLPSAAPMMLLFAALSRKNQQAGRPYVPVAVFAGGYIATWAGFSLAATLLQWWLEYVALLSPMMASNSGLLGAGLLIAAGIYQLTPLKHACLRHCRTPIDFIGRRWRQGTLGAFTMGLEHGLFCLGCCWVLMGLLFYGGIMNLWWIAGLAIYVLIEKLVPAGHWIGRGMGGLLVVWGLFVISTASHLS